MKKILPSIFLIGTLCSVFSCSNSDKQTEKKETKTQDSKNQEEVNDTTRYYPISFFLGEDIRKVVLSKTKIYRTVTVDKQNAKPELIDTTAFSALANLFVQKDIANSPNKKFYKENVFRNLSTNSVVFNYSTSNPDLEVRSIDASLHEGESEFYRLDIRTVSQKNDTSFTESYCWVAGKKFYISKYAEGKDKKGTTTTTTVTWDK
jgi:hypothetical protein